jgi:hypothetical protein
VSTVRLLLKLFQGLLDLIRLGLRQNGSQLRDVGTVHKMSRDSDVLYFGSLETISSQGQEHSHCIWESRQEVGSSNVGEKSNACHSIANRGVRGTNTNSNVECESEPVSGMAKRVFSVATRYFPWTEMPTPPPTVENNGQDHAHLKVKIQKQKDNELVIPSMMAICGFLHT